MGFTTNFSGVSEGSDLLPEGEYETIIKYAGEDATKGGTVYINVTCVVRNDVDQKYKNKYIWHSIWHKKEPSPADIACGGYSSKQINSLSKAAGLPDGKEYATLSDWCDELKNHCIRITVEHEEYNGKTNARVKWVNESKHPNCHHLWKGEEDIPADVDPVPATTQQPNDDFQEVKTTSDDDLPF